MSIPIGATEPPEEDPQTKAALAVWLKRLHCIQFCLRSIELLQTPALCQTSLLDEHEGAGVCTDGWAP